MLHVWYIREKCQQVGTGKRAQQLRMLDVSVEYLGLAPSTQLGLLTTTYNYNPMRLNIFWFLGTPAHTWCTDKQAHTHIRTN